MLASSGKAQAFSKGVINLKQKEIDQLVKVSEVITNGRHEFEVIDYVPPGYVIWNIGKNMIDGYLPIVQVGGYNGCQVNTNTMKAIKVDGAQTILASVVGGQDTVASMEQYIKRYKNAKPGTWSHSQVLRMKKALPIMKQIKGL